MSTVDLLLDEWQHCHFFSVFKGAFLWLLKWDADGN